MTAPLFELQSVSKTLGPGTILHSVSLRIDEGESALLLGNNGAGKTTMLRVLSGLLRPGSGQIRFRGRNYGESGPALRRAIGFLGHESRLYGDLTAVENLRCCAGLYGIPDPGRAIASALERVNLSRVSEVPVRALSSGMTRRVTLARLLVCDPEVLLLDEPRTGLDQSSAAAFEEILAEFRRRGRALVMTTHDFAQTETFNRILILHQGRLVYNQAVERPASGHCIGLLSKFGGGPVGTASPSAAP